MKLKTTLLAIIIGIFSHFYKPIITLAAGMAISYEVKSQGSLAVWQLCTSNPSWRFTTYTTSPMHPCSTATNAIWGKGREYMTTDIDSNLQKGWMWMEKLNTSNPQSMGTGMAMLDNNGKIIRVPRDTIEKYFPSMTAFNDSISALKTSINSNTSNFSNFYTKTQADARYIQTETDPVWTAASGNYLLVSTASSTYTPLSRTLTINGAALDLSANRSWSVGTLVGGDTTNFRNYSNSLYASAATSVPTSRTISTTSPLTGGGDLSANRTFAINNAAADNSTKGAATMDSAYFNDNGSGLISYNVNYGTGTISASAVTINQPRGKITYNSPNLVAAGTASITFTNSYINSTSTIYVNANGNGSNLAQVNVYIKSQTSGSCVVNVQNLSLLNLFNTSFIIDYYIVN